MKEVRKGVFLTLGIITCWFCCLSVTIVQSEIYQQGPELVVDYVKFDLLDDNSFPVIWSHLEGKDFSQYWKEFKESYLQQLIKESDEKTKKELEKEIKKIDEKELISEFAEISLSNKGTQDLKGVRVEICVQGYSESAIDIVDIKQGQTVIIKLTPAFSDKIFEITEQKPTNVYTKITTEGKIIYEKTKKITLLSRNDMVWMLKEPFDMVWGIVVFVTPHDSQKTIDQLLSLAAERMPNRSLGGYMENLIEGVNNCEIVELQVKSIYDTLKKLGVKYVNTPISFGKNAQRIKFPSESLTDLSGNCIELTLVFASAFESLGMRPVIVTVPGHAFVGVYSWADEDDLILIESTMVGTDSYEEARQLAEETFINNQDSEEFQIIDVELIRTLGVTPAPI